MNLNHMLLGNELNEAKNNIKKIFFYRICGTGMGACACLAKEAGFEVSGADLSFSPPMSTYLESLDIPLYDLKELTKEKLADFDLIVVGNSVPRNSDYASFIEELGIPFTSFPSFLGEFVLKDKEVIGLCGTHGKTTTTYFITQMLEALGEDTGYFVGGIIDGRAPSKLGNSKYFVIESDEYDSAYFQKISKFRLYELNHMILTSLEFDHADIFDNIEDIKDEFSQVLKSFDGEVVANDAYEAIFDLKKRYHNLSWTMYGENSQGGPFDIVTKNEKSSFSLNIDGEKFEFNTNIIGLHNVLNISSCILVLNKLGFSIQNLQKAVGSLGMVKRRQEYRGLYKGSIVIDDFAHHPKAITLTIDAIKAKYANKKIVTIFEPVSATARSNIFQKEFTESLSNSDEVIIAQNPLKTTVAKTENLNCELMIDELNKRGVHSSLAKDLSELQGYIDQNVNESNLFLILSNRTCIGLWESDFVGQLV